MIRTACYVACDDCWDPAEITTSGAKDARVIARNEGYVHVKRDGRWVDLCSRHRPAPVVARPAPQTEGERDR